MPPVAMSMTPWLFWHAPVSSDSDELWLPLCLRVSQPPATPFTLDTPVECGCYTPTPLSIKDISQIYNFRVSAGV